MEETGFDIGNTVSGGDGLQKKSIDDFRKYREQTGRDFILDEADRLMTTAADDPDIKEGVFRAVVEMVMLYQKSHQRDYYITTLGRKYKPLKNWKEEFKRQCAEFDDQMSIANAPDDDSDTSTLEKFGFYTQDNKYYFATQSGYVEGTNFVIEPLFHIYSPTNNRRLIRVTNDHNEKMLVDVPSDAMTSVDAFGKHLYSEGNYIIFVNNNFFKKLLRHIGEMFPRCHEIKTFGWQPEGFYAFSDGSYNGKWTPVDEMGIMSHKGVKYFSPAFSEVYRQLRADDDLYENDRRFIFRESSITIKQWSDQMQRVFSYQDNGRYGVAFLVASLFRSVIYNLFKVFPILFLHGETGSGKSQLGWSLSSIFQYGAPPFNLNSGTDVAFFRLLSRMRDAIVWFDEYTDAITEPRFQAMKSSYDGAGREKGKMSKDSRTESDKINSALVVSGQYLPQRDDNSLYNRSIVRFFVKPKEGFTHKETRNFDRLRQMEQMGLSQIITSLINERPTVEPRFARTFSEIFEEYKEELIRKGLQVQDRILRNYTILSTIVWIFQRDTRVDIGINPEVFREQCLTDAIEQSAKISSTDALGTFWRIISSLIQEKELTRADFDIQEKWNETTVSKSGGEKQLRDIPFEKKTRVLYLDFDRAYGKYMEAHRRVFGNPGLGIQTIMDYSHNHWAYIGLKGSHYFSEGAGKRTSAHMFDYDMLVDRQVMPEIQDATEVELPMERYEVQPKTESNDKKLPF